jgi:hypothetical protein
MHARQIVMTVEAKIDGPCVQAGLVARRSRPLAQIRPLEVPSLSAEMPQQEIPLKIRLRAPCLDSE